MDEKRSARRRKILQNAEKRLNKVLGTQASSGKPSEKPEQPQKNVHHSDDGHKDMTADSEGLNILARDLSLKNTSDDDENDDIRIPNQKCAEKGESKTEDMNLDTDTPERLETDGKADMEEEGKEIQTSGKFYRFLMLFLLALLLVIKSSWMLLSGNQSSAQKNSEFIPYFITLELVNCALFPVSLHESQIPPMFELLLSMSGAIHNYLKTFLMVFAYGSRLLEDLVFFIFSVVTINCLVSYSFLENV